MSNYTRSNSKTGCPLCLAFAIQSHDRSFLEALLSQTVSYPDTFVLPAPTVLFKDPSKCLRARIPSPAAEFELNRVGSCGHELIDCEIRYEFNQEYSAFYLESLIEMAISYSTPSFNVLEALLQSQKFDLSEPILFHRLIVPPYLTHHIREADQFTDCYEVQYVRSSSQTWIPGPLRLVNLKPVITSIGALLFESARSSNILRSLLHNESRLHNLVNRALLRGGFNDLWPFNLKSLVLETESSILVTFYRDLFSYDNLKLDTLNAYISKLEFLLALEAFDVNAPLVWRKVNCFDDGSRNVEAETHFLYELIGAIFSFPDRNAADHVLRLYRVLVRHGLCCFPAPEVTTRLRRSPSLSAPLADSIALYRSGFSQSQPDTLLVHLFGSDSRVPEYIMPRAETLVKQLFALGYARPELHPSDPDARVEPEVEVKAAVKSEAGDSGLRRTREYLEKRRTRLEAGAALRRLVAQFDAGPLALKSLARIAIRRALRGPSFARLSSALPLPRLLRDFVFVAEEELIV